MGGGVDAVVFSSTAEAQGFAMAMGGAGAVREAVRRRGVVLAAHGPYTGRHAGEVLGIQVPVVGRAFGTFDAVVDALSDHFRAGSPLLCLSSTGLARVVAVRCSVRVRVEGHLGGLLGHVDVLEVRPV